MAKRKTTVTVTNEQGMTMTFVGTMDSDAGVTIEYSVKDHTGEPMEGMESADDPFAIFRAVDTHISQIIQAAEELMNSERAGVTH